jgi:hypothetical protein
MVAGLLLWVCRGSTSLAVAYFFEVMALFVTAFLRRYLFLVSLHVPSPARPCDGSSSL